MASRRDLKKSIHYIANDLLFAAIIEGVNREVIFEAVTNVLNLIPRISHTQPGNVKGYYKKIYEELDKQIEIVSDELENSAK
ncbi:MAG: hypothetical protein IKW43_06295 [Bacteroidaceae bacterium]|nr:hypothetical protein [Bacteroidaceae bacterium]